MGDTARRLLAAFFAFALVFSALPGTSWTAPVDPAVAAGRYALVRVSHGTAAAVAAKAVSAGASEIAVLDAIDVITARVSDEAVLALRTDPRVAFVAADTEVRASEWDQEEPGGPTSAGVAAIDAPRAWRTSTGRGVVVAIMDTGVAAHPDLAGSVVMQVDFVGDGATQLDPSGHGTFVAGLIAAHGYRFRGVAPDATLVSLRVLDQNGRGSMHAVLAAFDWLLRNRAVYGIRVLNLSLGARQTTSYHQSLLAGVVESVHFAGLTVVAAAGNDGPAPGTIAMPGADPFVITTGSLGDKGTPWPGDDRESLFSSRGPTRDGFAKPDVLAPGEHVVSLRVPGTVLDASLSAWDPMGQSAYRRLTGTSASTAMVSGVAALVLQAHPKYTPTLVKGAIVAGAREVAGSATPGADARMALAATPVSVNVGVAPSKVLLLALSQNGLLDPGLNLDGITWEGISWEAVSWEAVSWESVSWESVTWESVTWEARP